MKGKTKKGENIGRKTLNRKTMTIKGCVHNPTYHSLLLWYNSSFEKFGSMFLEKTQWIKYPVIKQT
jgi:hypothetical protein